MSPQPRDRPRGLRATATSRRSSARSSARALACRLRRDRSSCEEALHERAVRVDVEVLLDHLARGADGEIHRCFRSSAMARSRSAMISARARSSIVCCSRCACSIRSARTFSPLARASAMIFCASSRAASMRLAMLLEQRRGLLAIVLRGLDRFLERLLARFDGGEDRGIRLPRQNAEDKQEDEQRPDHQPAVRREQTPLAEPPPARRAGAP